MTDSAPPDADDDASQPRTPGDPRVLLEWRVPAWRGIGRRRRITGLVLIFALLVYLTLLLWDLRGGGLLAAVFWVAVVLYFEDLFWPTTCRLTTEGVQTRVLLRWRQVRWPEVRRCSFDAGGVRVSSRRSRGALDPWRSVYLPADDAQGITRDRLIALVKEYRPAHAGPAADTESDA